MSDRKDKAFVRHSIDTGLESMQGNPFLAQRILNQERTEQPVMKKKISFAFILAMILLLAFAATAIAGSVNEDFNAWLYRIWPEAATALMPVDMSCENNGIRLEIISAVADGEELYITYSMEDLVKDRLNTECSPVMYVDAARNDDRDASFEQPIRDEATGKIIPDAPRNYDWDASFEQPIRDEATGKIIFGEHFTYHGNITAADNVLKAHIHNFISHEEPVLVDLFPYLEQFGSEVETVTVPEGAGTLWRADVYAEQDIENRSGSVPAATQVINPAYSREIRLADTVFLSGIGMVDGQLHVQLHFVDHQKRTIGEYLDTVSYRPDETDVLLRDKDSESWYDEKYLVQDIPGGTICGIGWGTQPDDPQTPEYAELIFAADADNLSPDMQDFLVDISRAVPVVGGWCAEIPVRLIRHVD